MSNLINEKRKNVKRFVAMLCLLLMNLCIMHSMVYASPDNVRDAISTEDSGLENVEKENTKVESNIEENTGGECDEEKI